MQICISADFYFCSFRSKNSLQYNLPMRLYLIIKIIIYYYGSMDVFTLRSCTGKKLLLCFRFRFGFWQAEAMRDLQCFS